MPEPCNGPGRPPTAASVPSNHLNHQLPPSSSLGSALSCVAPAATPSHPSSVPTAMVTAGNSHHLLLDVPTSGSPTSPVAPSPAPAALAPAPAPSRINGADSPPPSAPPSSTGRNSMGFQITSVTQSHTSADAVDESGDEECVVDSAPSDQRLVQLQQLASAQKPQEQLPVIPTTDGFGITLVAGSVDVGSSSSAEVVEFPSGIEMDVTPTGMTLGMATAASCCADQNTVDSWRSRFKVVRIETNLPFRRGRWQCMDYMDQPNAASAVGVTRDGSVASGTSSAHSSIPADPSGSEQVPAAVVAAITPHEDGTALPSVLAATGHTSAAASASSVAVSQHQPVQQAATLPLVQTAAAAPQPSPAAAADVLPVPVVCEPAAARVPTVIGVVRQCSVPTSPDTGVPSHHQPPPASTVDVHTTTSALSRTALSPSVSVSGISDSLSAASVGSVSLYDPAGSHVTAVVHNSVHGGRSVAASLSDMSSANESFTAAASDSGYSGGSNNPVDAGKVEPIDNKIEQAMDLVKSHLLLAVREEVDVLKASISRLMDRIGSLERENDILRGSVAPEVLQQLVDVAPSSAPTAAAVQTSPVPPTLQQPVAPGPSPAVTTAAVTSSQLPGPPGGGAP